MSDGIYYNQEVTADMLNDIAVDLGATSFNGFTTNKFGADALNGITSALVSKGVLTTGSMCAPVISDGKLYIQPGTIVFDNGAKKVITSAAEAELVNGSCVYALNDVAAGTCSIVVSEAFPESGDFVKLAAVDADGNITDMRELSIAKVTLNSGNNYVVKEWSDIFNISFKKIAEFSVLEWTAHKYLLTRAATTVKWFTIADMEYDTTYRIDDGKFKLSIILKNNGTIVTVSAREQSGGDSDTTAYEGTLILV